MTRPASDLYTLDTSTGVATKVGESGTQGFSTGLASDSKGRMYMKDFEAVFQVSPFTGHVFSPVDYRLLPGHRRGTDVRA